MMKLLVDIGNRRLKWATTNCDGAFDEHALDGHSLDGYSGVVEYDAGGAPALSAQLAPLDRPESVWVSCVARAEIKQAVAEYTRSAWSLRPVFIAARKQQGGIVNGYPHPAALGSDRWAALVAARELFSHQPVIVVDAGTAVTVDLLDPAGFFLGGVIFPGIQSMRCALIDQTENIAPGGAPDSNGRVNALATDTPAAVAGGALLAVAGGINLAVARQRESLQTDCRVIATGGDAARVAPLLTTDVEIVPQLVLRGLAIISQDPQ